ncbi:hypothetical protein BSPLISOX_2825 [uncultured Gammaproteobacteria bacterium]|jgi:hypothetical protein|nr:hypothetical protein [uncultured Gammaproteobacteria bacterium]CAC9439192.1 hypothetical protein [uncultured Gammaproteobacteria bacterium]VVH65074.1 hypothetical protein BSPLISOX_2825 [uncultured Gammaproteobacteria bacterium]
MKNNIIALSALIATMSVVADVKVDVLKKDCITATRL